MAIFTLQQAQDLRSAIPPKYLETLSASSVPDDVMFDDELNIVDAFEY